MNITNIRNHIHKVAGPIRDKYEQSHPHWMTTDSPLKYVSWAMDQTIDKCAILASIINQRGGRVFECGPGTGYLMYILREMYGCGVCGCDLYDRPLYREMHEALGITTVSDESITRGLPVLTMVKQYDLIVATQISWMNDWDRFDLWNFINCCLDHLFEGGQLVLFPNQQALHGRGFNLAFEQDTSVNYSITLPHLGTGRIIVKE